MKAAAFALLSVLILSAPCAYQIEQSREELLMKYYSQVDAKLPKSVRTLIGDERVNAYIGHSVLGIEILRGELRSLEYAPISSPSIVVVVDDVTAERIENRSMGIQEAIDSGGIRIRAGNWLSALKVEALKRAYSLSGIDHRLTNQSIAEDEIYSTNSLFMARARFSVWN